MVKTAVPVIVSGRFGEIGMPDQWLFKEYFCHHALVFVAE